MMHIKYKLDKSRNHGIGLFADQNIKKGNLIYSSSPVLDVNITSKQFNSLSENEQKEIKYWGFWIEKDKVWHVDFDVSKFLNHSFEPNTTQDFSKKDAFLIATKDIREGEELTQNYLEFESKDVLRSRGINVD
jgi:SET domain-containing protein